MNGGNSFGNLFLCSNHSSHMNSVLFFRKVEISYQFKHCFCCIYALLIYCVNCILNYYYHTEFYCVSMLYSYHRIVEHRIVKNPNPYGLTVNLGTETLWTENIYLIIFLAHSVNLPTDIYFAYVFIFNGFSETNYLSIC